MKRTERQARDIFACFQHDVLNNKHPKAINTEKFSQYVANKTGYNLEIVTVPTDEVLRGIILRNQELNPKKALIMISDSNNECWSRFTVVKEVCHLFLEYEHEIKNDCALSMAQSLMKHVAFMPNFLPEVKEGKKEYSEVERILQKLLTEKLGYESENLLSDYMAVNNPIGAEEASAVVAAIEIMIPVINKDWISLQVENNITLYDLASQLKVPKLILEYRLNQWFIKYNA